MPMTLGGRRRTDSSRAEPARSGIGFEPADQIVNAHNSRDVFTFSTSETGYKTSEAYAGSIHIIPHSAGKNPGNRVVRVPVLRNGWPA